jgi:hypothetical protein
MIPVLCDFFNGDGVEEGHGGAEGFADDFDWGAWLRLRGRPENSLRPEFWSARNRLAKRAVLDFGQDLLHGLLAFVVDDARAADVVAPLGGVGDGVAHVSQAAAIDEIDNELQFMQDLEVGALGLIAGFGEGFIARLDEGADAAAEHGLLAEEIGLGFFFECGFENAGAGAADALEIAEIQGVSRAGCVLVDGDEAGNAAAFE